MESTEKMSKISMNKEKTLRLGNKLYSQKMNFFKPCSIFLEWEIYI